MSFAVHCAVCLCIVSRTAAIEPTIGELQRWLQDARAAKIAADGKVAQAVKHALEIRAQRDKINAEIKDLKAQMASADQTIKAAQTELNKGAGTNAQHLQELVTYEKSLERSIQSKMPGTSLKDGNGIAAIYDKLNDKNFKEFGGNYVDSIRKEIEANESKHRELLDKAGAAQTSRAESIRLTDEELPKLEQAKADLQKKLDQAIETERIYIRNQMDELSTTTSELKQADADGKLQDAARRLYDAQHKKNELLVEVSVATDKLLKLSNYDERRAAAQESAAAADEVRDLEKRLAEAQAAAAAAAKAQPKPPVVTKAKPAPGQASASAETNVDDTKPPAPPPSTTSDQVTVPDLSVFDNVSEMKAVLAHAGLVGAFNASGKPPSKDLEFKFSGQSPPAIQKSSPARP